jgi:hypothetical protein
MRPPAPGELGEMGSERIKLKENRKPSTGSTRGTTGTAPHTSVFHFHQRGLKLRRFRHKFTRDADALGLGNFRKSRAVLVSEPLKEALPSALVARHAVIDSTIPRIVEGIWTQ